MKLCVDNDYMLFMRLLCLFKVYHDAGNTIFDKYANDIINDYDFYWMNILEAIEFAAPITVHSENLYTKYGYDADDGEVYIWAYSCKEMQEYFKIARKLSRLEGKCNGQNLYEKEIMENIESIRGFYSYSFDYNVGHKRKGAWLEVLWSCEFECEISMCIWITRVMKLFKEELPKLKEKYRTARRLKRSKSKRGGMSCAAK